MIKAYSIHVSGKVQGVFFRASTQQKAVELGLTGFVRNEPDGSVYIECEGEEAALEKFKTWCHNGPPSARVNKVDVAEIPVRNLTGFEGRR